MRYSFVTRDTPAGLVSHLIDWPIVQADGRDPRMIHKLLLNDFLRTARAYIQQRKAIPLPNRMLGDFIQLNSNICLKIFLHNALLEYGSTRASFGALILMTSSEVTRLFDLEKTTNPDTMMNALRVLGYGFDMQPVKMNARNADAIPEDSRLSA